MKLSVITVNLNNAHGLQKTILSIISQTFQNFEYIIIDGGSVDDSLKIIKQYPDNISKWVSEPDDGIYNAMNKGIRLAQGDYLLFLNSGDQLYASDTLWQVFETEHDQSILYGNVCVTPEDRVIRYPGKLTMAFLYEQTIVQQSIFYRRDLFHDLQFDESYRLISDWIFLMDQVVFKACSYLYVDLIIANYDATGLSSEKDSISLIRKERERFLPTRFPELVLDDFQTFFMLRKSELYESVVFLQRTTGLRKFVAALVSGIVKCYKFFKRIESKT
ncbi:MAG: glycosyltransferase family 2 protein [Bacteroidota bacterium]|nr:glycosyltransferase family 2 protein [Bacteroidota bacterium]